MTEAGVGDGGAEMEVIGESRGLLDHGAHVVDRFCVLGELEVGTRPIPPGVELVGFCLEGGLRRLQRSRGTFLGSEWSGRCAHTDVEKRACLLGNQIGKVCLRQSGVAGIEQRRFPPRLVPDAAVGHRPAVSPDHLQCHGNHLGLLKLCLCALELANGDRDDQTGIVIRTGSPAQRAA